MILENIVNQQLTKSSEELKEYIHNLSDSDKTTLLSEIEAKKKSAEDEYIRLETMKTKLEEDENAQMERLKTMGINSYQDLDIEINKIEKELDEEIVKYAEALRGE